MRVVDLFSGMEGWATPFRDRGHKVFTVDNDPAFKPDLVADVAMLTPADFPWKPDVVLASPPCTHFTVMRIGRNRHKDHTPRTAEAAASLALVQATINLILALHPRYWVVENPRAKLRRLYPMTLYERHTVTYCQYGESRMKPTDLWGKFPDGYRFRPMCSNGDPCHTAAPRGSMTATQGMSSADAALVPYELSRSLCVAMEGTL